MDTINRIASFSINHDKLLPGLYVSRIDGDVTTYDLRMRRPNTDDLISNSALHSLEHLFATYIRNGALSEQIIYFGPMGCQTGFYLLVRNADNEAVLREDPRARGPGLRRIQPRVRQLPQPERSGRQG